MTKQYFLLGLIIFQFSAKGQEPKFQPEYLLSKNYNDRILVVGGGGARGAWGAGFAEYLVDSLGAYRTVIGTSTGSLMAPLIVLRDFRSLQTAYTSVNQHSIFNVNPFNEKTGSVKKIKALLRDILGKQTLGESKNLKNLINTFLPKYKFDAIRNSKDNLSFIVSVVNLRTAQVSYKSSSDKDMDYEEMKNWIWASSNEPLFMSYYDDKRGNEKNAYVDGGVRQNVPILEALEIAKKNNSHEIDVIINKPLDPIKDTVFKKRDIFSGLLRLLEIWETQIRNDNVDIPRLQAIVNSISDSTAIAQALVTSDQDIDSSRLIKINTYFYPSKYFTKKDQNELVFNQQRMNELWKAGASGETDTTELYRTIFILKNKLDDVIKTIIQNLNLPTH